MDEAIENALAKGGIADITTIGRRSGLPRRIEIYFHNFDGAFYLSGRPGFKRDWVANLTANPQFTLHLKRGVTADLPAVATVIKDPQERWNLLFRARTESWRVDPERARRDHQDWVDTAPLVSFNLQNG
jgi:deazaflavin-dependent oxidoreductase (nitroreductase family)